MSDDMLSKEQVEESFAKALEANKLLSVTVERGRSLHAIFDTGTAVETAVVGGCVFRTYYGTCFADGSQCPKPTECDGYTPTSETKPEEGVEE